MRSQLQVETSKVISSIEARDVLRQVCRKEVNLCCGRYSPVFGNSSFQEMSFDASFEKQVIMTQIVDGSC